MELRSTSKSPTLLRDKSPREPQYNQRSSELGPRAMMDPQERRAGVLFSQEYVAEAVNKADDDQLEAKALKRGTKAERIAKNLIIEMRAAPTFQEPGTLDSWAYAGGGAAATDIIGASGTAEGRSTYET